MTVLLLLVLSSCGDGCYDEVNVGSGGSYTTQTYTNYISATSSEWVNTGITLTGGTNNTPVTIQNVSGMALCQTNNTNAPGACTISSYTTFCSGGVKYNYNPVSCAENCNDSCTAGSPNCIPSCSANCSVDSSQSNGCSVGCTPSGAGGCVSSCSGGTCPYPCPAGCCQLSSCPGGICPSTCPGGVCPTGCSTSCTTGLSTCTPSCSPNCNYSAGCTSGCCAPGCSQADCCPVNCNPMCDQSCNQIPPTNLSLAALLQSSAPADICSGQSNCTINPSGSCSVGDTTMCYNGTAYIYNGTSATWVINPESASCTENAYCQNNIEYMDFSYSIGGGPALTTTVAVGTCNSSACTGSSSPHAIPAYSPSVTTGVQTAQQWIPIDSNILPGDIITLTVGPPNTTYNNVTHYLTDTSASIPELNAWVSESQLRLTNSSCPAANTTGSIPLQTAASGPGSPGDPTAYTQCTALAPLGTNASQYYTCPVCNGPPSDGGKTGRGYSGNPSKYELWYQCNDSDPTPQALECWYVGGAGMWLQMVDSSTSSCSDLNSTGQYTCSSGQGNCIWFDQWVTDDVTNNPFGIITYNPNTNDGQNCPNPNATPPVTGYDASWCTNRITQRQMVGQGPNAASGVSVTSSGLTTLCAKIGDNNTSFDNNIGGYIIEASRQSCVAYNGSPSAAGTPLAAAQVLNLQNTCNPINPLNLTNPAVIDNVMALEYLIWDSPNAPIPCDYGIPISTTPGTPGNFTPITISPSESGTLYLRVRDSTSINNSGGYVYLNNSGGYNVTIQYQQPVSGGVISEIIGKVKCTLQQMTLTTAQTYIDKLTCNGSGSTCASNYPGYIRILLTLYIAGYGLSFLIGTVKISQWDFLVRVLKIGLVLALTSSTSFCFFYNDFFSLFFNGMDELIQASQSGFADGSPASQPTPPSAPSSCTYPMIFTCNTNSVFAFADNMISITLFSTTTWLKLLALTFISPIGLVLAVCMILGIGFFLVGIFKAVVVYLMAVLVLGILMLLAPFFIPFCLFKTTEHLFENWWKMCVRYTLEPVMLLIGLGVLTQLAYVLLIDVINFHVCWKCIWPINFAFWPSVTSALGLSETIFCIQFFGPFGMMPSGSSALISALGLEIVDVLLFVIIGHLILGFDKFIGEITHKILGGKHKSAFDEAGSAGSAVFAKTGIPAIASQQFSKVKSKLKRAAINMVRSGSTATEEEKLLKVAKNVAQNTENAYLQKSANLSKAFSVGLTLNNTAADLNTLSNAKASSAAQALAARNLGSMLYSSVGQNSDYKDFVGNLSKLTSIEEGSEAYKGLSTQAQKLRETLLQSDAQKALKMLNDKKATESDKKDAAALLSEAVYKYNKETHKVLYTEALVSEEYKEKTRKITYNEKALEKRTTLMKEVNDLGRADQTTFRKAIPKGTSNE